MKKALWAQRVTQALPTQAPADVSTQLYELKQRQNWHSDTLTGLTRGGLDWLAIGSPYLSVGLGECSNGFTYVLGREVPRTPPSTTRQYTSEVAAQAACNGDQYCLGYACAQPESMRTVAQPPPGTDTRANLTGCMMT